MNAIGTWKPEHGRINEENNNKPTHNTEKKKNYIYTYTIVSSLQPPKTTIQEHATAVNARARESDNVPNGEILAVLWRP